MKVCSFFRDVFWATAWNLNMGLRNFQLRGVCMESTVYGSEYDIPFARNGYDRIVQKKKGGGVWRYLATVNEANGV